MFEEALPDSRLARSPSLTPTEVFSEPRSEPSLPPFPPLTTDVTSEHGVGHSIPANEASPEYRDPHSPSSPATGCDPDIERFRGVEHDGANILPDSIPSPTNWRSPRIDDLTPTLSHKMGSASVPPFETSIGTQILQTPDLPVSTAYSESEFGTPRTILEESVCPEHTGPSHNPEPMTAEAEVSLSIWSYLFSCELCYPLHPFCFSFSCLVILLNNARPVSFMFLQEALDLRFP